MGYGDNIMATGMARGASARGKRIAFGRKELGKIEWDHLSEEVFRNNPNIARPGSEKDKDLEWINYSRANRQYNRQFGHRWLWNYSFRPKPGEIFFSPEEQAIVNDLDAGYILMEPHVPSYKQAAPNKDWGFDRYQEIATRLIDDGYRVAQLRPRRVLNESRQRQALNGAKTFQTNTFREALMLTSRAGLYIGPEGGLHHAAAAFMVPGVVIFGGFIPPKVTGYDIHTNLTGNSKKACGLLKPCEHCRQALDSISVDEVHEAAMRHINGKTSSA